MVTAERTKGAYVIANAGGWGNIGDDAITLSLLRGIAELTEQPRFALLSGPDSRDVAKSYGENVVVLSESGPLRRVRSAIGVLRGGALIVGGGGLLQDRLPDFYRPYYRAMRIARAHNIPLSITSVGVTPPRSAAFRQALRELAAYASHFTVRDAVSAEIVREVTGLPAPDVVPDAAFGLRVPESPIDPRRGRAGLRVGVAIRPWWHLSEIWGRTDPDRFGRLLGRLADALRSVTSRFRCDILLIPMHVGTTDDDRQVGRLLEKYLRGDTYVTHAPVIGVTSAIEAIRSCDAVVGMRLHSLILAAMNGVPSVALAYDDKVFRAMERIGRSRFAVPIEDVDPEWLANSVTESLEGGVTENQSACVQGLRDQARRELVQIAANHRALAPSGP
jgi:polysaccharide pyruvyl transferase WcaK-like protein